jgi:hypothetical protein
MTPPSTAVFKSTLIVVSTLLTVFNDRAVSFAFSSLTSSVLIVSNILSPNAGMRCTSRIVRLEGIPLFQRCFLGHLLFDERLRLSVRQSTRSRASAQRCAADVLSVGAFFRSRINEPSGSTRRMSASQPRLMDGRIVTLIAVHSSDDARFWSSQCAGAVGNRRRSGVRC